MNSGVLIGSIVIDKNVEFKNNVLGIAIVDVVVDRRFKINRQGLSDQSKVGGGQGNCAAICAIQVGIRCRVGICDRVVSLIL